MLVAKGMTKFWKNHPNKDEISFQAFRQRVERRGLSFEEAMSLNPPRKEHKRQENTLVQFYENHPNRHTVSLMGFYKRVNRGMTPEEAMSIINKDFKNPESCKTYINKLYDKKIENHKKVKELAEVKAELKLLKEKLKDLSR